MENNSSAFQLNQYRIESVQVTQNKSFNRELSERSGSVTASVNIAQNKKDDRKYRLTLNIDLNPTEEGGEEKFFPYYINIKGQGFFLLPETMPT